MRGWKIAYGLSRSSASPAIVLLDWTNAYGIRLLLPFSSRWFQLDLTNIFDFWFWGILALAWLGPLLAKLVSSEIGARPGPGAAWPYSLCAFLCVRFRPVLRASTRH